MRRTCMDVRQVRSVRSTATRTASTALPPPTRLPHLRLWSAKEKAVPASTLRPARTAAGRASNDRARTLSPRPRRRQNRPRSRWRRRCAAPERRATTRRTIIFTVLPSSQTRPWVSHSAPMPTRPITRRLCRPLCFIPGSHRPQHTPRPSGHARLRSRHRRAASRLQPPAEISAPQSPASQPHLAEPARRHGSARPALTS